MYVHTVGLVMSKLLYFEIGYFFIKSFDHLSRYSLSACFNGLAKKLLLGARENAPESQYEWKLTNVPLECFHIQILYLNFHEVATCITIREGAIPECCIMEWLVDISYDM
jgi:hypothetical protein